MSSNITPRIGALLIALLIVGFVGGYYLDPAPESGFDPEAGYQVGYDEGYGVGYEDGSGLVPPDTDGDGIPDAVDQCPDVAGDPAFGGCPVPLRDTIRMGTTDQVEVSLDTAEAYDYFGVNVLLNIGEGLYAIEPETGNVIPALAADMPVISGDGLEYTIDLRQDATFQDGTPFTASAVKFSIDRTISLELDPSWLLEMVESVEVTGTHQVKITLSYPATFFTSILSLWVTYPVNPNTTPADEALAYPDIPDTIGPYILTEWLRFEYWIFEANPEYYGTPPKTSRIVVRHFEDATTLRLAVEVGEIDLAFRTITPTDIEDLKEDPDLSVLEGVGAVVRYLVINPNIQPFGDKLVRQALAAAVDRSRIVDLVFLGTLAGELYSQVPMGMPGHTDSFKDKYGEGPDLDMARQLLDQAGFSETNKLTFDLWYTPVRYGETEPFVAQILKEDLEATGMISITLQSAEWSTMGDLRRAGSMPVYLLGWYPDFVDPDNYIHPFFHSSQEWLWGGPGYSNPEMDDLIIQERAEADQVARAAILAAIQVIMAEDAPIIPLWQTNQVAVTQLGVEGVVLDISQYFRYWLIWAPER